MDDKVQETLSENLCISTILPDIKQEPISNAISKRNDKMSTSEIFDEKDLLIAQLQEQVDKQKECIMYYESIVQLMNYRLMKLKKVLKTHQLLEELN